MESTNTKTTKVLPVMLAFIVMGFVDIVGVSTGYIKNDFELSDRVAQVLPSMTLIWFFVFSVPTGLLLDRFGKKVVLNTGILITGAAMLIPFVHYSYPSMLIAFIFLGIGNTIVQVSANPLLHDVVPRDKFSSFMSLSQFIKAISSLLGPIIATFLAIRMGNWKLVQYRAKKKKGRGEVPQDEPQDWRLYDLTTDIGEESDVADDHKEIVERLLGLLDRDGLL